MKRAIKGSNALLSAVLCLCITFALFGIYREGAARAEGTTVLKVDKVDKPISGRTAWTNENRPLGFIVYVNGVTFEKDQVHLQNNSGTTAAKASFKRDGVSVNPVLICASIDGGYGSKSFIGFYFPSTGLSDVVKDEYKQGDEVVIEKDFTVQTNKEGIFAFEKALHYVYDGSEWKEVVEKTDVGFSSLEIPVDNRTNWANDSRPIGLVTYVSAEIKNYPATEGGAEVAQTHVESKADVEKVTFTRGDKSEHPILMCAGLDGGNSKSFVSYFFAGAFVDEEINTYQTGDRFVIEAGFSFTVKEGVFEYPERIAYVYNKGQWEEDIGQQLEPELTPTTVEVDGVEIPVKSRTDWTSDEETKKRPLGVAVYVKDVKYEYGQVGILNDSDSDLVTFTRGEKSAHPKLMVASIDAVTGKSFVSYFFGGDLENEALNTYLPGDRFEIEEGFTYTTKEGYYTYGKALSYIFNKGAWEVYTGQEAEPEPDPQAVNVDKAAVPVKNRTDWTAKEEGRMRPLGVAVYLDGVDFDVNQVNLQSHYRTDVTLVTFTRGDKTANPVLLVASKDGQYGSKSFIGFYFGGALENEEQNVYQNGDEFEIKAGFIFVTAEGAYTFAEDLKYIFYNGEWQIADPDLDSEIYTETVFTYVTKPEEDGEFLSFSLRSSARIRTGAAISDSLASAISINGNTLKDMMAANEAEAELMWNFLTLKVSASALKLDGTDELTVSKGAEILENSDGSKLLTLDDEKFVYSATLERWELVPDFEMLNKTLKNVTVSNVEIAASNNTTNFPGASNVNFGSLWFTFTAPVDIMPVDDLLYSLPELAERGLNTTDLVNYGYAKMGVYASAMDYLYLNGQSLRSWIEADVKAGKGILIRLEYLNTISNRGRVLRVLAAEDSALKIGAGMDQNVEFKKGFATPDRLQVSSDQYFEITKDKAVANAPFDMKQKTHDGVTDAEGSFSGQFSEPETKPDTQQTSGGCSAVNSSPVTMLAVLALAMAVAFKKQKSGEVR